MLEERINAFTDKDAQSAIGLDLEGPGTHVLLVSYNSRTRAVTVIADNRISKAGTFMQLVWDVRELCKKYNVRNGCETLPNGCPTILGRAISR